MKKRNKLLFSTGATIAGLAPVAIIVSCGKNDGAWKENLKENLYVGGPTQEEALKLDEKNNSLENKSLKFVNDEYIYFNYQLEQEASVKIQEADFAWQYHKLLQTKDKIKNLNPNDQQRKDNDKSITELKEKMNKISNGLPVTNNLYEASDFSTKYPKILLPFEVIRKKQEDIFSNTKAAFIEPFGTKAEGQSKWLKEMQKKYNGAKTEKEAIDKLTFGVIKNDSNLKNEIIINNNFTVEQLNWANVLTSRFAGEDKTKNYYDFLKVNNLTAKLSNSDLTNGKINNKKMIVTKGNNLIVTGVDKLDKVYFYGSKSNINEYIKISEVENKLLEGGLNPKQGVKPLRLYRHTLLNIRPDDKGRNLPWVAPITLIKSLMKFQPGQADSNITSTDGKHQFNRIKDIFTKTSNFSDKVSNDTRFFLAEVSNNSDGTKTEGGSLGIQPVTNYSNQMFNGFALGALTIEKMLGNNTTKNNAAVSDANDDIYTKLENATKAAYNKILKIGNEQGFTSSSALDNYLNSIDDSKLIKIFGTEMRNLFDPQNGRTPDANFSGINDSYNEKEDAEFGRSLLYTDGSNEANSRFIIISTEEKGGLHLVKRFTIGAKGIDLLMKYELEEMADSNDTTNSTYNIKNLIKPFLTNERILKTITQQNPKAGSVAEKFKNFIKAKYAKDADILSKIDNYISGANDIITSSLETKIEGLSNGLSNGHYSYLEDGISKRKIAYFPYDIASGINLTENETLIPEEIYEEAYKLFKLEYGGV